MWVILLIMRVVHKSIHITCKLHAVHHGAETIRKCFPQLNEIIARTMVVFLKVSQIVSWHSSILQSLQALLTSRRRQLGATFYDFGHYQQ